MYSIFTVELLKSFKSPNTLVVIISPKLLMGITMKTTPRTATPILPAQNSPLSRP